MSIPYSYQNIKDTFKYSIQEIVAESFIHSAAFTITAIAVAIFAPTAALTIGVLAVTVFASGAALKFAAKYDFSLIDDLILKSYTVCSTLWIARIIATIAVIILGVFFPLISAIIMIPLGLLNGLCLTIDLSKRAQKTPDMV